MAAINAAPDCKVPENGGARDWRLVRKPGTNPELTNIPAQNKISITFVLQIGAREITTKTVARPITPENLNVRISGKRGFWDRYMYNVYRIASNNSPSLE